jgi:hypothetical protein
LRGLSGWPLRRRARVANRSSAATMQTARIWGGTCLANGRRCDCEMGRVGDDCAASAISLPPAIAFEVWFDDEHALKTVHMDGWHVGLYWNYGHIPGRSSRSDRRSYVLYDLNQITGNLTSTESGGAHFHIKHPCSGLTEVAPVQETEAWSSVASMTMQQAIDSFPISGTGGAGTVNYNFHTGPCCPHNSCSRKCYPQLDVTKLVFAATKGSRKMGFRMRGLDGGWCNAGKDEIILELRGMTRLPSPSKSDGQSGSTDDGKAPASGGAEEQGSGTEKSFDTTQSSEQDSTSRQISNGGELWQQDWFWGMVGGIIAFLTLCIAAWECARRMRPQSD